LVHQREPLNKELNEANPSQVCHDLGLLCILASPLLKHMDYKKGNHFGNLVVPLGPLDIIVIALFALPNPNQILGMFTFVGTHKYMEFWI
jgi:hypothetical protein